MELVGEYRIDPIYGCRFFTGMCNNGGYAIDRRGRLVHRLVYEDALGPLKPGLELDHKCRRRNCIRVEHLEPVTRSQNEKAKSWRRRSKQRRCKAGHDQFTHGRLTPEAGRVCLACAPVESE
jgi:hypothetical protein